MIGIVDLAIIASNTFRDNAALSTAVKQNKQILEASQEEENDQDPPNVKYPGDDPKKAPEGTEWRGKGPQGSNQGNYYNPETKESWHPDLEHEAPVGKHWDYTRKGISWRIYPNGRIQLK